MAALHRRLRDSGRKFPSPTSPSVPPMKTLILSCLFVVGCASAGVNRPDESAVASVLTVTNQRTEDVTIYVIHGGDKGRRLGQVNSLASAAFVLTAFDTPTASDVQFLARVAGTGATELSDAIVAARGASYDWRLGPARGHQFLSFRFMPK